MCTSGTRFHPSHQVYSERRLLLRLVSIAVLHSRFACLRYLRLILYFPVSALVTLFANILQNPQDARARSDVKLMNQVVNFLSFLAVTEEQGGVKRMLGVCAEFERIARVVLEKGDKESHKRRKRRNSKMDKSDPPPPPQQIPLNRGAPPTPQSNNTSSPENNFTPEFTGDLNHHSFDPSLNGFSPSLSNLNIPLDFSSPSMASNDFPNMMAPNNRISAFPNSMDGHQLNDDAMNICSFQQPFVPQDLWQMPMTLEWDWAGMSGEGNFPQFDAGNGQPHNGGNSMEL